MVIIVSCYDPVDKYIIIEKISMIIGPHFQLAFPVM